jgi:hypothetical protein
MVKKTVKKEMKKPYQKPVIYPVGSFVKQTLGSRFKDTADLKNYYS